MVTKTRPMLGLFPIAKNGPAKLRSRKRTLADLADSGHIGRSIQSPERRTTPKPKEGIEDDSDPRKKSRR